MDNEIYRGNTNLKRANQSITWTKELVAEYVKCANDPIYFAQNYVRIVTLDHGLKPVDLYDYQKEIIQTAKDNRYTVAECARQSGKSTSISIFIVWYILFHEQKSVALLANKAETAREILGRVQLIYEHLPKWLQHGVIEWNKGSFVLENGSRVIASATSSTAIRGFTFNIVVIDEAAHIENWDEFFTSVYPTISSGKTSKLILISTVYGMNHFYAITSNARQGKNAYKLISVPWHRVPGRDAAWKQDTLAAMNFDLEKFSQEYENEYHGSSGTLIAGWKLKELVWQTPLQHKDGVYQYKRPEPNKRYALIADVSRGKGLDFAAFSIIDISEMPYEQVCVYRNNMILPIDYTEVIHNMAKHYNDAIVLVETNDIGEQICDILYFDYEYINIIQTENAGAQGKRITQGFSGKENQRGIRTTIKVKNVGCSILKMLIEQNQLILNDEHTIEELSTFTRKGKSYEAESGKHDDLVMGLVLFAWMTDQAFFKEYSDINTLFKLREKTEDEIMNELTPFGIINDGRLDEISDEEHVMEVLLN